MSGSESPLLRLAFAAAATATLLCVVLLGATAGAVSGASGLFGGRASTALLTPPPAAKSSNGWPWGQCTWYVAIRRAEIGEPVTWGGDAWQWLANAAAMGWPETSTPSPGEIAVYIRGGQYDAQYGHVAFVIAATATGYTVAEANVDGLGVVDTRVIAWPDPQVAGFIE